MIRREGRHVTVFCLQTFYHPPVDWRKNPPRPLGQQCSKGRALHRFGKNVNNLLLAWNVRGSDKTIFVAISNDVAVDFKVLRPPLEDRVSCNVQCGLIITVKRNRLLDWNSDVFKEIENLGKLADSGAPTLIFCLGWWTRDGGLFICLSRDKSRA